MKKLKILLLTMTSLLILGCGSGKSSETKEEPIVAGVSNEVSEEPIIVSEAQESAEEIIPVNEADESRVELIVVNENNKAPIVLINNQKMILNTQDLELFSEVKDDGGNIKYEWKDESNQLLASTAVLKISAPHQLGEHHYTITVTDDKGLSSTKSVMVTVTDSKYEIEDYGLNVYAENKIAEDYALEQMDDASFSELNISSQYKIADKLLSTLFFAHTSKVLRTKVESGTFIADLKSDLLLNLNNMDEVENKIHDTERYYTNEYRPELITLSRFFEMKKLDKNFFDHWVTYILTQTILFSPASELSTVAQVDSLGVYNRLYNFQKNEIGMKYASFIHMQSDENWRRFRSPEDNGREMLEIFSLDMNDNHVPLAAQALKNWKLSRDKDTLVIGLNENNESLSLNGDMQFTTGFDFYAALANSQGFTKGVTTRLVDFMFMNTSAVKKEEIINKIVSSNPNTWSDILTQIIFSTEYLLNMQRVKSMEENVFPLMKKLSYNSYYYTFNTLRNDMINMGQAAMRYKLGRLNRVPLDDVSFATYQKHLRDNIFRTWSRDTTLSYNPNSVDETHSSEYFMSNYKSGYRRGISSKYFMTSENYEVVNDDAIETDKNYIQYLFNVVLNRDARIDEMDMFINHLAGDNTQWFATYLNYINVDKDYQTYIRYSGRYYIQYFVFEYILRLDELYFYKELK